MLTLQYLEASPALLHLELELVVEKLRAAAGRLPFTHLLIGWHVPSRILEACRKEAEQHGMRFLRWQPLLTLDPAIRPDPAWRVTGLMGDKLAGYRGLPEFTFACPNHPAVQEAVYMHLERVIREGLYQGLFLDRVRYPSPASCLPNDLACFCEYCRDKAAQEGLDLSQVKIEILRHTRNEIGVASLVKTILSGQTGPDQSDPLQSIGQFLTFRKKSIRDFLAHLAPLLRDAQMEIGLDCFSPSLTHLVGQDLARLGDFADWIKLMSYTHTLAPAGIPFELSGLVRYLISTGRIMEAQALELIGKTMGLPLPPDLRSLERGGLSPDALQIEVDYGVAASSKPVLAGIELVEAEGATNLLPEQIRADLSVLKHSGIAGLALSWDLLHIPLERLELVRQVYSHQPSA